MAETVATPVIGLQQGGHYRNDPTFTITCSTIGASIGYGINGESPNARLYAGPITATPTANHRFDISSRGYKSGWNASAITSKYCTFQVGADNNYSVAFSVNAGTYTTPQSLTLSVQTIGAAIYYTTNGSTPTSSSTRYTGTINLPLNWEGTIKAIGIKTNYEDSNIGSNYYKITGKVDNPTSSVNSGTFYSSFQTTLSCATNGATIYYTTNGSTPTSSSSLYTTALNITQNTTLKFVALKTDWLDSDVITKNYAFNVNTPEFSLPGGTYTISQNVTLTCATSDATIYYTTDGSQPNSSSLIYSTPIVVAENKTIKAYATKSGYSDSSVSSETYVIYLILGQVENPVINPSFPLFQYFVTIGITTPTQDALIYYTIDGSTPNTTTSPLYTGVFQINTTTTVKAIGVKTNFDNSSITSKEYQKVDMPLLCWQFVGRRINGKVFVLNGDGEHPKVFSVPTDVDVETCCLVDEGIEVEKSQYVIEVIN